MKLRLKELLVKVLLKLSNGILYTISETKSYNAGAGSNYTAFLTSSYCNAAITAVAAVDHDLITVGLNKKECRVTLHNYHSAAQSGTITITYFMKA